MKTVTWLPVNGATDKKKKIKKNPIGFSRRGLQTCREEQYVCPTTTRVGSTRTDRQQSFRVLARNGPGRTRGDSFITTAARRVVLPSAMSVVIYNNNDFNPAAVASNKCGHAEASSVVGNFAPCIIVFFFLKPTNYYYCYCHINSYPYTRVSEYSRVPQ